MTLPQNGAMAGEGDVVQAVRPMTETLLRVDDAGQELASGTKYPDAGSTAMMELANEQKLQGSAVLGEPIQMAHSMGGVLAFASADHIRNYALSFQSNPVPVYSHLVVARACLDACSVSAWLSEDEIGVVRRAQRALVVRISSAKQLKRSPIPEVKQRGKAIRDQCIAGAAAAGWQCETNWKSDASPEVGGERLPSAKQAISAVLGDDPTDSSSRLGPVL